jgi:glycosyltransferase involved in cell wall biosynthesis
MSENNPFVSIIIPFFNNEAYAARAIESALKQTFAEKEIILVDNNSTDNTHNVLSEYQSRHPQLIRVFRETRQGCPAARNKGLQEARGEWVQILDSDDELLPEKIEHQIPLTKDSEIGLIIGATCKHKLINKKLHTYIKRPDTGNVWRSLLLWRLGSTNACLWKKDMLVSVNGWNVAWSSVEDYELYFRVIKAGVKIAFSPYAEAVVHMRADSMSRSNNYAIYTRHIEHALKARLMIRDYMRSNGLLTPELEKELNRALYFKLLGWKRKAPEYVNKKLKELKLDVPMTTKLGHKLNVLKRRTYRRIKLLFNF